MREREREKDREREREREEKKRERERDERNQSRERERERERRERPTKEFEELVYCALWLLSSVSFLLGRILLNCGTFSLAWCTDSLWLVSGSKVTVECDTELYGFGSGDFLRGTEASDVMSDVSSQGRCLSFQLIDCDSRVILERQRSVPSHLESESFWNKVGFILFAKTVPGLGLES